jgi:DNA-formamidopyrimidine glycosylase
MPEGPEVRRHADALDAALAGQPVVELSARTKAARAWLAEHPPVLCGRTVKRVFSHGKNLVGVLDGGYFFYSHLMMWGRWQVVARPPETRDRRERARIVTPDATALLFSAPRFEVGEGEPYDAAPYLATLGPDVLPCDGVFDEAAFRARLAAPARADHTVGAVLLDQTLIAGVGNYLRAEILFACRLDPWRRVADLTREDIDCLARTIPEICRRAYHNGGVTVGDGDRERMRGDDTLVYRPGTDWGTRHFVFRRTNLPCLVCGGPVRQLRQLTWRDDENEKERIIYFCPVCQQTDQPLKPVRPSRQRPAPGASAP